MWPEEIIKIAHIRRVSVIQSRFAGEQLGNSH